MKKLSMTLISLLLCVCLMMPMASAFTWQTSDEGNFATGNQYRIDFSSVPAFPAKSGVTATDKGSYTRFTATGSDPWVNLPLPSCASNQMKYLVVVYNTPVTGAQAKLSFYTAYSGVGISEKANSMVKRAYEAAGKWDAMIFDMTDTAGSHKYTTLRMDMLDLSSSGQYVDIKTIIGFPTYEQAVAYEANQDNWDMLDDSYSLDFTDSVALTSVNQLNYSVVEGKFTRFTATGGDPFMTLPQPTAKATAMDYAVIHYRTKTAGAGGEFYVQYKNASGTVVNMGAALSRVGWSYGNTSGQWATQIVDLTSISANAGSNAFMNLRIDPLIQTGTIDIASITCFSNKAKATAFAKSLEGFTTDTPTYYADFTNPYTTLRNRNNMSYTYVGDQYIRMTSTTGDPNIWLPTPMCDSKDMRYVVLVYRTNSASQGEIYVRRSDGTGMGSSTRVGWTWGNTSGAWATQTVDLNAIAVNGVSYTAFRLDPLTVSGKSIDLRCVAGFATAEDAAAFAAGYRGFTTTDPSYEADFSTSVEFKMKNQVTTRYVADKFTRFTATGGDPYVELPTPTARAIHMKYAVLVYRTNVSGAKGEMYAARTDGTGWGGAHTSWTWQNTAGQWDSMVVDVSSIMSTDAQTSLTSLRFDPLVTGASGKWVDLRSIALFETRAAADAYAASFENFETTVPNYVVDGGDKATVGKLSGKNGVQCSVIDDSYLRVNCTSSDPYFNLPAPGMAGKYYNYVTIFYRLPSGGSGEFFVLYDGSYHHKGFHWPATSGNGWGKVIVDLSSVTGGDKHPSSVRLDPLITTGSIDIRMIAGFSTYEDAAAFELSDFVWSDTAYEDKESVALDTDAGTLKYVYNSDDTVTISYTVNGTSYSYTVPNDHNYLSGAYAGTDDLGRELPSALDVGVYGDNGEHYVGLFYFLWMGEHGDSGVYDLQDILDQYGQSGAKDLSHYGGQGAMHWFSEPLYGYYYSNDAWVMRKHMEQLSNANIDFLYLDLTNGYPYISSVKQLMSICSELNAQGFDAPQIVPYTNTSAANVVRELYDSIYSPQWCPDTWFRINGKPVIVAPYSANIDNFFTIKQNQWPNDPNYKTDGWPWMDFQWPQRIFTASTSASGDASAINVSIAQHSGNITFSASSVYNYGGNRGRSFNGNQTPAEALAAFNSNPDLTKYGYNFQAQWDRAIAANVPYVLVTGWNEWVAQLQPKVNTGYDVGFIDTASEEFSRDAEMLRGGYFDNYYMQLIANVSKLKGAAPIVVQDARKPINVTGDFSQWNSVIVDYNDPAGDMLNRHGQAFGNTYQDDTTGRNDIVASKVTSDTEYIYFYVETANNISMYNNDASWMQLFVNTDRNAGNGWYGCDYVVNYNAKDQNTTTVAKYSSVGGSFSFTEIGDVQYQVKGNQMMIAVPQSMLGIEGYKEIYVEFKWADADVQIDEMEDFYTYGDAAPAGRLNNVYQNYIPGLSQITYENYAADDTALEAAIAEAEATEGADYVAATYEAYVAAAAKGEYYVNNPYATQAEVDAATAAIKSAKDALTGVSSADKTALRAAVNAFGSVNASDYTAASYKAYSDAVAAGKTVLNNASATQSAVDAATTAINTAKSQLEEAPAETEPAETEPAETEPEIVEPVDPAYIIQPDFINKQALSTAGITANQQIGSSKLMTEGERSFVRLTASGGDPYVAVIGIGSNLTLPRYMAISYRPNSSREGQFFMGSGSGWTGRGDVFNVTWTEGGWSFMVIDLNRAGLTALTNGKVNYTRLDFFTAAAASGDYFDVEYIAFFDTAAEAAAYDKTCRKTPMWDLDKSVVISQNFDQFYLGDGTADNAAANGLDLYHAVNKPQWDYVADLTGTDYTTLTYWGWITLAAKPVGQFGYQIDGGAPIYNSAWTYATEQAVINAAISRGGATGTRMKITLNLEGLEGEHQIRILYKDASGNAVCLNEITVIIPVANYTVPLDQWTVTGHKPGITSSTDASAGAMVAAGGLKQGALLHQGAIGIGTVDLSKYSKVVITYGCDASSVTKNYYNQNANNRIILSKVDTNGTMSPSSANVIASATYTLKGWKTTAIEIDLTGIDYNGPVYVTYDTLPGTFMLVGSIEFIAE